MNNIPSPLTFATAEITNFTVSDAAIATDTTIGNGYIELDLQKIIQITNNIRSLLTFAAATATTTIFISHTTPASNTATVNTAFCHPHWWLHCWQQKLVQSVLGEYVLYVCRCDGTSPRSVCGYR